MKNYFPLFAFLCLAGTISMGQQSQRTLPSSSSSLQEFKISAEAEGLNKRLQRSDKVTILFGRPNALVHAGITPAFSGLLTCTAVPTASQATNFYDHAQYFDRDIAASLKITWIASGNVSADNSSRVFVRDYAKFARCPASDKSGNVLYGSSLRATVLVDQNDVSAGANFAVAAASATVKQRAVQVSVDGNGFKDANVNVNASAAQNITASGLRVEDYSDFNKAMSAAFDAAVKSDIATMQPIGFEPAIDTTDLVKGIATTFALDRLAQGYGCDDAVKHFNRVFPDKMSTLTESAIRATYQQIAKGCDASSAAIRAVAESIIGGQRLAPKE